MRNEGVFICFDSRDDMETTLEAFQGKGLQMREGFPGQGSHDRATPFGPESTEGILSEVCEESPL